MFEFTDTAVQSGTVEANEVAAYVVPPDEYKNSPELGDVDVPVPPYCVAKFVCESTVCPSEIRTPDELVSPAMVSLFFTLKFLSDNLVHVSPYWYVLIIPEL